MDLPWVKLGEARPDILHTKSEAVTQRVLHLKYLDAISGLAHLRPTIGPNTDLLRVTQAQWYAWTKTTSIHNHDVEWFGSLGL